MDVMTLLVSLQALAVPLTGALVPLLGPALWLFSGAVAAGAGMAEVVSALPGAGLQAVKTLPEVINSLQAWIMGILAAIATLFMVIGGLRYVTAAGDPASVEQAKGSFKAALTGYALAVLAPVILQILRGILGA